MLTPFNPVAVRVCRHAVEYAVVIEPADYATIILAEAQGFEPLFTTVLLSLNVRHHTVDPNQPGTLMLSLSANHLDEPGGSQMSSCLSDCLARHIAACHRFLNDDTDVRVPGPFTTAAHRASKALDTERAACVEQLLLGEGEDLFERLEQRDRDIALRETIDEIGLRLAPHDPATATGKAWIDHARSVAEVVMLTTLKLATPEVLLDAHHRLVAANLLHPVVDGFWQNKNYVEYMVGKMLQTCERPWEFVYAAEMVLRDPSDLAPLLAAKGGAEQLQMVIAALDMIGPEFNETSLPKFDRLFRALCDQGVSPEIGIAAFRRVVRGPRNAPLSKLLCLAGLDAFLERIKPWVSDD